MPVLNVLAIIAANPPDATTLRGVPADSPGFVSDVEHHVARAPDLLV